jgi:L-ribulokinase
VPLALSKKWQKNLNAQCWLWKDHTSWREASKITALSAEIRPQYIAKCGNTYSSEWWWSKIWHCLNVAHRGDAGKDHRHLDLRLRRRLGG